MQNVFKVVPTLIIFVLLGSSVVDVDIAQAARSSIHADSVLAYTNAERYKKGLPILNSNRILSEVARTKMYDLFSRQYFDHVAPTGETVSDLVTSAGYAYIVVGENLALGDFTSSKHVVEAWMDSKGHRENILAEKYSEIGIAAGRGNYDGRNTWVVVQTFGHPKSACPIIDKALEKEIETLSERLEIYSKIAEIRKEVANRKDGTYTQKKARVEAYNIVAKLFNNNVEKYQKLADEYNKGVGEYNSCLKKVIGKM